MADRRDHVGWRQVRAYRRAARRPSVGVQSDGLLADLDRLRVLMDGGDAGLARGAALSVARAALALSVTPVVEERLRSRRRRLLCEAVSPVLRRAGLGHVESLLQAALVLDVDPSTIGRGRETMQ